MTVISNSKFVVFSSIETVKGKKTYLFYIVENKT